MTLQGVKSTISKASLDVRTVCYRSDTIDVEPGGRTGLHHETCDVGTWADSPKSSERLELWVANCFSAAQLGCAARSPAPEARETAFWQRWSRSDEAGPLKRPLWSSSLVGCVKCWSVFVRPGELLASFHAPTTDHSEVVAHSQL